MNKINFKILKNTLLIIIHYLKILNKIKGLTAYYGPTNNQ